MRNMRIEKQFFYTNKWADGVDSSEEKISQRKHGHCRLQNHRFYGLGPSSGILNN
jgi:hypothetical protein